MTVQAFRIQNFMCFEDSGWVELRPLTLFYGRNSAGKSAFLRSLLLLRQTLQFVREPGLSSQPDKSALIFAPDDGSSGLDFGSYRALVRDHDIGRAMSFWFECAIIDGDGPEVVTALSGLGIKATVQIRLSYGLFKEQVRLQEVALYDDALDEKEGLIIKATAPQPDASADQAWRFEADFFVGGSVWPPTALVVEEGFFPQLRVLKEDEAKGEGAHLKEFGHIQQLLCHCKRSILEFFKTMEYIGPRRPEPQRFYHLAKESNAHSANGQHLVCALLSQQEQSKKTLSSINQWLAEFGLPKRLQVKSLAEAPTSYQLLFTDPLSGTSPPFQANITEVGFGMSQLLPVVIETLLALENSTLVIEQPELHLAPTVQSQLADLLIYVAVHKNVRLLVETHSENLLIRVRRRVAESSAEYVLPDEECYLPHEALRVHFVNKEERKSEVRRIDIGPMGGMLYKPPAYRGFFSSDLRDTVKLTKAQLGR